MHVQSGTYNVKMEVRTMLRLRPGDEFVPNCDLGDDSRDLIAIYEGVNATELEADLKNIVGGETFNALTLKSHLPWAGPENRSDRVHKFLNDCRRALIALRDYETD